MGIAIYRLLVTVLIGSGLVTALWLGPVVVLRASASHEWPTTDGEMTRSEAVLHRSGGRNSSSKWYAEVEYRYAVDGVEFRSDDVWVEGAHFMRSKATVKDAVKRFPAGEIVQVRYDPDDPEVTCLIPGGAERGWATIGFGALLMSVGGYFVWKRQQKLRR